jgi:hypothetical protein
MIAPLRTASDYALIKKKPLLERGLCVIAAFLIFQISQLMLDICRTWHLSAFAVVAEASSGRSLHLSG